MEISDDTFAERRTQNLGPKAQKEAGLWESLKPSRRRVEPDGKGTKRPTALRALSVLMPSH
jgi:hypothetical protein